MRLSAMSPIGSLPQVSVRSLPNDFPARLFVDVTTSESVAIWNSGPRRLRVVISPGGMKLGLKKLNTVSASSGAWPTPLPYVASDVPHADE